METDDIEVSDIIKIASATTVDNLSMGLYYVGIENYKPVFVRLHSWPTQGGPKSRVKDVGMIEATGAELDLETVQEYYEDKTGVTLSPRQLDIIQDAYDEVAEYYFNESYMDYDGGFKIDKYPRLYASTLHSLGEELGPIKKDLGIEDEWGELPSAVHRGVPMGSRAVDNLGKCEIHIDITFQDIPDNIADAAEEAVLEWRESYKGW